jgi:hypothetical protein
MTTAVIIAVVAILIVGAAFLLFHKASSASLTAQGAENLVVNDIKTQNPTANVTVISVTNSTHANSWEIVSSVIYNGSKPCPTVFIDIFDYPALGLQNYSATPYASDCKINGATLTTASSYIISLPAIAIARSYSANYTPIRDYVSRFGYDNTFVHAKFLSSSSSNSTIFGNQSNVWLVTYTAANANYSVDAVVAENGTIIQTNNVSAS